MDSVNAASVQAAPMTQYLAQWVENNERIKFVNKYKKCVDEIACINNCSIHELILDDECTLKDLFEQIETDYSYVSIFWGCWTQRELTTPISQLVN